MGQRSPIWRVSSTASGEYLRSKQPRSPPPQGRRARDCSDGSAYGGARNGMAPRAGRKQKPSSPFGTCRKDYPVAENGSADREGTELRLGVPPIIPRPGSPPASPTCAPPHVIVPCAKALLLHLPAELMRRAAAWEPGSIGIAGAEHVRQRHLHGCGTSRLALPERPPRRVRDGAPGAGSPLCRDDHRQLLRPPGTGRRAALRVVGARRTR
jgi:hypothetical protein